MRAHGFRWPRSWAGRAALVTACACSLALGLATGAKALWFDSGSAVGPAVRTGTVAFAASTREAPGLVYSPDGSPVRVTLPGSVIGRVLEQTGVDPDPIVWTFEASGWADGIAGMAYDVVVSAQVTADGGTVDLTSGVAAAGTLLHYTTTTVYPAAVNGDCSAVPATPEGVAPRDVYVFGRDDVGDYHLGATAQVLQAPGGRTTGSTSQLWCVAMSFDVAPDGDYVNDVQALGRGLNGKQVGATDTWDATVAFPPSLPALGEYYNLAQVWGTADDLTISRDQDDWDAVLFPDPSGEPSVTITLDPAVINANPDVAQPSDHFARTGS